MLSIEFTTQHCRYNGPCLLEAIDSLQTPERDISKPLCMPICDVSQELGKVSVTGKLESGAIRNGSKVHTCIPYNFSKLLNMHTMVIFFIGLLSAIMYDSVGSFIC